MDHGGRLPYQPSNPPGNWKMGQNTPQAVGKGVLDTFMPHPGIIPGPGGAKNGCFGVQKQPKWQGAIIDEKSTWKEEKGPKHTPGNGKRSVRHFYAPSRGHPRSRWVQKWVLLGPKTAFSAGTYFTPLQYNERQIIIMHCLHRIVINSSKVLVLFVSKGLAALKGLVKFLGSEASRAPEPPGAP